VTLGSGASPGARGAGLAQVISRAVVTRFGQLILLQARVDLTQARTNEIQAYYNYNVAVAALRRAIGEGEVITTNAPAPQ